MSTKQVCKWGGEGIFKYDCEAGAVVRCPIWRGGIYYATMDKKSWKVSEVTTTFPNHKALVEDRH